MFDKRKCSNSFSRTCLIQHFQIKMFFSNRFEVETLVRSNKGTGNFTKTLGTVDEETLDANRKHCLMFKRKKIDGKMSSLR